MKPSINKCTYLLLYLVFVSVIFWIFIYIDIRDLGSSTKPRRSFWTKNEDYNLLLGEFKPITNGSYVYAAYHDTWSGEKRLIITGVTYKKESLKDTTCNVTYQNKNGYSWFKKEHGIVQLLPEDQSLRYTACLFICSLTTEDIPIGVSILTDRNTSMENFIFITHSKKSNRMFTVCMQPLFGAVSPHRLVEWFEFNQILGADRFVVYTYNISQDIESILRYYRMRDMVEVITIPIPDEIGSEVKVHGQMMTNHDCLFRNVNSTKFVVNPDFDEYLIPKEGSYTWTQLIEKFANKNVCEYRVRTSQVPLHGTYQNGSEDSFDTGTNVSRKYLLTTMLNFMRNDYIYNKKDRTKYFVRPECVSVTGVHIILKFLGNLRYSQTYVLELNEALGYHFRYGFLDTYQPRKVVRDTYLLKYRDDLVKNVQRTWADMSS